MTTHTHDPRAPFAVVVNDDPIQLQVLSELLRKAGLEPRVFTAAEAALAAMVADAAVADGQPGPLPALIVTDLHMPGIDGWRFCRLLRSPQYAALNQIPILVVSATFVGEEPSRIAADLGAEVFVPVPVDGPRFCEQVRTILRGERMRIPLRVLIVDENAQLCDLLKEVFANHGYEAETALTMQAAAAAFAQTAYDVAVLAYHLPDGSGDALLEAFRARRPDCVCVMTTSATGPERAMEWMKRGAAAYVQKPFHTEYLIDLCAKARRERALLRVQDLLEMRTRELRASVERFRGIVENSEAGYFFIDREGYFRAVNAAWLRLHKYSSPEEILGRHFLVTQAEADEPRAHEALERLLAGEAAAQGEFTRRCADGSVAWHTFSVNPVRQGGLVVGLEGFLIDITERKRAQAEKEKLEAQNRQLQKSESLGRMAGAIAHHFNNQLHAVMMNLEMVINDLPPNARSAQNLAEAMQSARKAAEVSGLMLTYLGQTYCEREPLDLSEVCRRSLPMLQAAIPRDVVLETNLATPGPAIHANANQIQQVLINLVTNAWEAGAGGHHLIRLTVKTVAAADISAVSRFPIDCQPQEDAYACLEVADTGCGISDQDIERLFDPFFTNKFPGRGLGLPVALGIVRAHGGAITVESEPGRGSVFRVFLPVSPDAVPRKPVQVVQAPNKAGGGTVLLAEDEPAVRQVITLALKRLGFTVLAAADGVEAVEIFRQHRAEIGCVLCDLSMPRMDGWETLTALRQLAPDLPVILASGYSEAQVMEGHHPELPQAFLSKPYDYKALGDTLARVMMNKKT